MEKVEYSENLNEFHTYFLDEPVGVNGIFYIGWSQLSNANLNIGYDRYNNAQEHIFSNTQGIWEQSPNQGAILMRPLLGKKFNFSGVNGLELAKAAFYIYPNPVKGNDIFIRHQGQGVYDFQPEDYTIKLFSMLGNIIYEGNYQEVLHSVLPTSGVYMIQVMDKYNRPVFNSKIIKQ